MPQISTSSSTICNNCAMRLAWKSSHSQCPDSNFPLDAKSFYRPMNRVVYEHIRNIKPQSPPANEPVFRGGSCRPNSCFVSLCNLAGIRPKQDLESGKEIPWHLKDLRKTCATYYDEHIPESSVEIPGHAVGGITYRHYAHRDPLAFRALMTIPQPSAFLALVKGHDGECPCCIRPFQTAD